MTSVNGAYVALCVIFVPATRPAMRAVYSAALYSRSAVTTLVLPKLITPS